MSMIKNTVRVAALATALAGLAGVALAQDGRGDRGPGDRAGDPRGGGMALSLLRAADVNGDKAITTAELSALQMETFAYLDRNADGVLDIADRSPIEQRLYALRQAEGAEKSGRRGERAERVDVDGDGAVSLAEFTAREADLFARFDTNVDGVITGAEIDAVISERRGDRAWWRDEGASE